MNGLWVIKRFYNRDCELWSVVMMIDCGNDDWVGIRGGGVMQFSWYWGAGVSLREEEGLFEPILLYPYCAA